MGILANRGQEQRLENPELIGGAQPHSPPGTLSPGDNGSLRSQSPNQKWRRKNKKKDVGSLSRADGALEQTPGTKKTLSTPRQRLLSPLPGRRPPAAGNRASRGQRGRGAGRGAAQERRVCSAPGVHSTDQDLAEDTVPLAREGQGAARSSC